MRRSIFFQPGLSSNWMDSDGFLAIPWQIDGEMARISSEVEIRMDANNFSLPIFIAGDYSRGIIKCHTFPGTQTVRVPRENKNAGGFSSGVVLNLALN